MVTAAVVGGRGKTGRAVAAAVEAAGGSVRPIGRAELHRPVEALAGCEAVYLIAPNMHPDEPGLVAKILTATQAAGVSRLVYHSVAAPYLPEMPHHLGKAESERLVRASSLPWVILQPGVYMQNFVPQLASQAPSLTVAYNPQVRFTLVDLEDVAAVASLALTEDRFLGATLELGGPQHLSVEDIGRAAGELLGRQVPVRSISTREWARGPGAELTAREREWLTRMFDYYDARGLLCGSLATEAALQRSPTPLRSALARELQHLGAPPQRMF